MTAFAEFLLVATALYLWESLLWLPLGTTALRHSWPGNTWRALDPGRYFTTRATGVVPLLPVMPDSGLAPCQSPPLIADRHGNLAIRKNSGDYQKIPSADWPDLSHDSHHLQLAQHRVRLSSGRSLELLRRARKRGLTLAQAADRANRLSLSPSRAGREWKRWKLVSKSLKINSLLITLGFFAGLPASYVFGSGMQLALVALWIWLLMVWTAAHLHWLARRVYRDASAELNMDALLSLLVPFHAMRAHESAAVHAMATTHFTALLIHSGDLGNRALHRYARMLLHPRPGYPADDLLAAAVVPVITGHLERAQSSFADFDRPPHDPDHPGPMSYCPRCHGIYQSGVTHCTECADLPLQTR